MIARSLFLALALAASGPVYAAPVDDLYDALALDDVIVIMRDEGLEYGADLSMDMSGTPGNATWAETLSRIYDTDKMAQVVRAGFEAGLEGVDLDPLLAFFQAPAGQRVVELEVSARRALMDADVEEAARSKFRAIEDEGGTRMAMLDRFIETNDLIEANVVGAMNANFQFYAGLSDGGAVEMSEGDILTDVWSQEAETREDTREWMYAYLLMAYGPLPDDALKTYIDLSATPEGRALNRALFDGFNAMYDGISYGLGLASAQEMRAEEL